MRPQWCWVSEDSALCLGSSGPGLGAADSEWPTVTLSMVTLQINESVPGFTHREALHGNTWRATM